MFVKLLKWEFRSTGRRFSLAFLIYACLCVALPWILLPFSRDAAAVYSVFTLSLGLSAFEIVIMVMLFQHYNSSLYGCEGYLQFTLPIDMRRVLGAKLLAAVLWVLAANGMFAAGGLTALHILRISRIGEMFPQIRMDAGAFPPAATDMVLSVAVSLMTIFFSVTVSRLAVWRKGGTAMGILTFLLLVAGQVVVAFLREGGVSSVLTDTTQSRADVRVVVDLNPVYSWRAMGPTMAIYMAVCVALFAATAWLLERKTELK
mgnify:CR=1 FL=1